MIDARGMIGTHDVLFITLDTLRYDAAQSCWRDGRIPNLAARIGPDGWERRHAPGSFTYASHHAFFAGFLPTPMSPGPHRRMFAVSFPGSETTMDTTAVFETPTVVEGFAAEGYRTICIGGVGFFNTGTPLGSVLPGLFQEAHFSRALGVTDPRSTENQVELACERLAALDERVFLFLNVSAIHQPNRHYVEGAEEDTVDTHAAALAYVDRSLPPLFEALARRGPTLCIVCSDHGTTYGEEGHRGHRVAHPVVWEVPYAEWVEPASRSASLDVG